MPTRITVIHRIVIAIAIQVQTVDGFGVEVGSVVRADEAAPFGAVIPGVAIIQASIFIVVIATTTNRIGLTYILPNFPPVVKKSLPDHIELGG